MHKADQTTDANSDAVREALMSASADQIRHLLWDIMHRPLLEREEGRHDA